MSKISTRDLFLLPDVGQLARLLQSMAMLDAILCPAWDGRYYSFNARWAKGRMLGSMRNGSGDEFYALFNESGCFLKGFAHEAPMSPHQHVPPSVTAGVLDDVPMEFADCLKEPAFDIPNTTFCIWRRHNDAVWQCGRIAFPDGPDPDGSEELLSPLDGDPATYTAWAQDYYGEEWDEDRQLDVAAVKRVYSHEPLTNELVRLINPELRLGHVAKDAKEIGYPL